MTPERRVAKAIIHGPIGPWTNLRSPGIAPSLAVAALNAVREALASDDPKVVRAMAERVGLSVTFRSVPGWPVRERVKVCFRTRWMEASDANA